MSFLSPRTAIVSCEDQLDLSRLEAKITGLENFQTPRTAMEFFAAVEYVFEPVLRQIPPSPFRSEFYILDFEKHPNIQLELAFAGIFKRQRAYTSFTQLDPQNQSRIIKKLLVHTAPAGLIPGLENDISLGRNEPGERMPTLAVINGQPYVMKYGSQESALNRMRLS